MPTVSQTSFSPGRPGERLRACTSLLGQGNLGAAGLQHENVVFDEFFNQFHMGPVLLDPGLVQPTTPATPRMRPLMILSFKRRIRAPERAAQHVVDVLVGETRECPYCEYWEFQFPSSVFKPADRFDHHIIGTFLGVVVVKFDMGGTFDMARDWW
jgi:hypothetical protein